MALWWTLWWSTMVAAFLSCWGSRWIRDMLVICWLTRSTAGWFSTLFAGMGGFTWVPLMDAVLVRRVQALCLASGVNAEFLHYGNPWFDYVEMIEACSGLGGVSHGALAAGIHTTVATDSTGRMPDLHPVHVDCEHVTGDIGDLLVVAKAAMLGVSMRVPVCLPEMVLGRSGVAGACVESRAADGLKVLQAYMVRWVSRVCLELMHRTQTYTAVVGLARFAGWRGWRVSSVQAQEEQKVVSPDTPALLQGDWVTYTVGSFPFGIDRQGLGKNMRQANWQGEPLQPAAPQPGRCAIWVVQAVDVPLSAIVPNRTGALEGHVHKLMQKQTQMDRQFVEFTNQPSQQVSNLQTLWQNTTQQLQGQCESPNQSIQVMIENQLSLIRGLLLKRPRDECECWEGPELPGWDVSSVLSSSDFSWWVALVPVACFLGIASSLRCTKRACRLWLAMEFVFLIVVWVCVASHPGHADAVFVLGIVNPTGLRCNTMFVAVPMVHGGNFIFRWHSSIHTFPQADKETGPLASVKRVNGFVGPQLKGCLRSTKAARAPNGRQMVVWNMVFYFSIYI